MYVFKKDFVDENTNSYCGKKKLSSGTAYFLRDYNGNIRFAGKKCAEKCATNNLKQIPDFTKSLISRREGQANGGGTAYSNNSSNDFSKADAITYIVLREEKLSEYEINGKGLSYEVLKEYYEQYKRDSDLSDQAVAHILKIESNVSIKNKRLSLINLSTCYAYQFILERTIVALTKNNNVSGVSFVKDLLHGESGLKLYCSLTKKQINSLSKMLQFLPGDLKEAKLRCFDL